MLLLPWKDLLRVLSAHALHFDSALAERYRREEGRARIMPFCRSRHLRLKVHVPTMKPSAYLALRVPRRRSKSGAEHAAQSLTPASWSSPPSRRGAT
jgi:hypothetical protein